MTKIIYILKETQEQASCLTESDQDGFLDKRRVSLSRIDFYIQNSKKGGKHGSFQHLGELLEGKSCCPKVSKIWFFCKPTQEGSEITDVYKRNISLFCLMIDSYWAVKLWYRYTGGKNPNVIGGKISLFYSPPNVKLEPILFCPPHPQTAVQKSKVDASVPRD